MNSETELNSGFRERLALLVGTERPFEWAKAAGVPSSTWNRAWNEGGIPKARHLAHIADYAGVTLDWLVTGRGPMRRSEPLEAERSPEASRLDETLLADAIKILEEWLVERHATLLPVKKAEAVAALYELGLEGQAQGKGLDRERARIVLRFVA